MTLSCHFPPSFLNFVLICILKPRHYVFDATGSKICILPWKSDLILPRRYRVLLFFQYVLPSCHHPSEAISLQFGSRYIGCVDMRHSRSAMPTEGPVLVLLISRLPQELISMGTGFLFFLPPLNPLS